MISVVIPCFREQGNKYLVKTLANLSGQKCEVICVDSSDDTYTKQLAKQFGAKYFYLETSSRGARLTYGVKKSSNDMIILHHPRSELDVKAIHYLNKNPKLMWGAFTHKFDTQRPLLQFTSWYSNYIRGGIKSIYYLDHCIFVRKSLLKAVNYVPEVDIFEDTLLSYALRKHHKPIRLPFLSVTSAQRFTQRGFFKQALLNQKLKLEFTFGRHHKTMNQVYEKHNQLNTEYK